MNFTRLLPLAGLAGLLMLAAAADGADAAPATLEFASPSSQLLGRVSVGPGDRLHWSLQRGPDLLIEPSPMGVLVDDADLGLGKPAGPATARTLREVFPWRGGKRFGTNHCRAYTVPMHSAAGTPWVLEVRVFDDGWAYRYRVPGTGPRRIRGEASSWTLPAAAEVWLQTNTSDYEGEYHAVASDQLPREEQVEGRARPVTIGPPVTARLARGGFVLLTEANLARYSGMSLRTTGPRRLGAMFEDDPDGFTLEGEVVTPWRVTVAVTDLDALVNSDVIPSLADAPDPALFPDGAAANWIQPGKALITWCVYGNDGAQWPLQKWFVDQSVALRCEHLLIDAGWRTERWGWAAGGGDVWARLREICAYAAERGVGIVVWHAYPEGRDDGPGLTRPEAREELFARCAAAGVKGVKIDFFNSERLEVIQACEDLARRAAKHRLMINFHGAHKATGEARTWPNEITREGLREQEYVLWGELPHAHYTALPFTRLAVGHGDFLPGYVAAKYLRNTTAVFQMATAIVSTSPFLCWPDHPEEYRVSPFLGLVQALPTTWDETRVLPGSSIGGVAALARRSGSEWFVGVLNGGASPVRWATDFPFLSPGDHVATFYRDTAPARTGVSTATRVKVMPGRVEEIELAPGGGWVGWIKPSPMKGLQ